MPLDLFSVSPETSPQPPVSPVFTVGDLTRGIRELLEDELGDVQVEGELSNVKLHTSGHLYFTLKDADAQLRGVMWRSAAAKLFFRPADGLLVRIRGGVTMYEVRGELQLSARKMTLAGEGALQKAFEDLKRRLHAEGLFDEARKRPLPRFPERIGVITSATGAAVQDVLSILARRYRYAEVFVCGVPVQGLEAAEAICEAIETFSRLPEGDPLRPDVLIVGRGGGSLEDLWAFNEEAVARAIAGCSIPVVSAVGHETDFTIADFAADVRAATPSMAAELVAPHHAEIEAYLYGYVNTLRDGLTFRLREAETSLRQHHALMQRRMEQRLARASGRAEMLGGMVRALDPLRPLRRGFALVERDGEVVNLAASLKPGEIVRLRFADGARAARIEDASSGEKK